MQVDLIGFTRCMGSVAARISFKQGAKLDLYDPSHHAHISHDEEDEEEEKEEGDESESEDTRAVGLGKFDLGSGGYISMLVVSCFMRSAALESFHFFLPYPIASSASYITTILISTLLKHINK